MHLLFICFTTFMALMASVGVALGVAAITFGWVLPRIRPRVERPRLYGWGALLMALSMVLTGRLIELFTDPIPGLGPATGSGPLFLGAVVIRSSRRPEIADPQEADKP
ncbi:hypothetical protein ACFXAW_15980 [Streptomyces sp. NPDC059445]|uniref:hypothetical protein n=1 Tax=unclassified Streptomyces TaxID=2593676 RepID=UPI0036BCCFE6